MAQGPQPKLLGFPPRSGKNGSIAMIAFVLRHADRLPDPSDGLRQSGFERAKLLARMLSESGVTRAYCSEFIRTSQTIAPLQEKLGATLIVEQVAVNGAGGANDHVNKIVQKVKSLAPETVVIIVTHSNTVGRIISGLGGGVITPIGDNEFDKLFVLTRSPNGVELIRLRYGAETP